MSAASTGDQTAGRIVVGVDGSPSSEHALQWAAGQAELTGCELHAVLAWHVPFTYGVLDMADADWAAHGSQTLAAAVTAALEGTDSARVGQQTVEDYPAAALLHAAEEAISWWSDPGAAGRSPACCSAR